MATYQFKLPDIGEGIAEAEIVAWHVQVGDMVAEDQQLADMMTDKATVEMESPVAGKVVKLAGEVGDMVPIGSVLAVIETEGDSATPAPESKDERPLGDGAVAPTPAMAEELPVTSTKAPESPKRN
jgi:2-oxoisovalerate dehydrogenase E2 component (dihydrolipoyl transacylase)